MLMFRKKLKIGNVVDVFISRIIACNTGMADANHVYFLHVRFSEIQATIFEPLIEPIIADHAATLELLRKHT